jgi:transcriptional regulator with XRE-family HTH domain
MEFGELLRGVRHRRGLSQAEIAEASGVARPNIAAFEAGRREPRWGTAVRVLGAAGASVVVDEPVRWSWTTGRRPYAVPSALWRLPLPQAVGVWTPGLEVWWSGDRRAFDLSVRRERLRAYEIVLREGVPSDIEGVVDGALLLDAWNDLVLPAELRAAWGPLIDAVRGGVRQAS